MASFIRNYFNWLQKGVPTGEVEKYPLIDSKGETSVKGIYIAGDLTGIPLLKLASESGKKIIDQFISDPEFQKMKNAGKGNDVLDIVIVGAGPAGISAGIEAAKNKLKFTILESAQKFNTIINFPKGKPIYAEPSGFSQISELKIADGTKESLLDDLYGQLADHLLPIEEGVMVDKIEKKDGYLEVITKDKTYKAVRVILTIGKSGNSRMLNAPGENLPKVYNRLFDPADAKDHFVLVAGGGDSALETAIATAEYAKLVTISYRKGEFARPKEGNIEKLHKLVEEGKIRLLLETTIKEVKEKSVVILDKNKKETEIENTMVFSMIGKELPLAFFRRSGIKMEGELTPVTQMQFVLLFLVAGVIYFGKSSGDFYEHFFNGKAHSFGEAFSQLFTGAFWIKLFTFPAYISSLLFSGTIKASSIMEYIEPLAAWVCFLGTAGLGSYLLYRFIHDNYRTFSFNWKLFKYAYFITVGIFFVIVFFGGKYFGVEVLGKPQGYWYTGLYSLTILIFGLRRIYVKPTRYIKLQTMSLTLIQIFPLFLLPEIILPYLGSTGALGSPDGFLMSHIFPNQSYWRTYGLILAWPLNFSNLYTGSINAYWFVFSIVQTFVIIPFIVYKWGKGAYCGWICSCGALAETLGDDYRTLALHGPKAKKFENTGQWILAAAFLITGLKLISILYDINIPVINEKISYTADFFQRFYSLGIDVVFAGFIGVGVYFFLSGRVWCRFGCPLAAWMHIISRFSRYRIFAEKKKCISCNICTKVCHMGIDVMNYANKGIPMNDVECVRCSACIVNCPTQVLSFGSLPKMDTENKAYKNITLPVLNHNDWRSGL